MQFRPFNQMIIGGRTYSTLLKVLVLFLGVKPEPKLVDLWLSFNNLVLLAWFGWDTEEQTELKTEVATETDCVLEQN